MLLRHTSARVRSTLETRRLSDSLAAQRSLRRPLIYPWRAQCMHTASSESNITSLNSPIPIYDTVSRLRRWRAGASREGRTVGFVPTMGALHEGHLDLVRTSLDENDETVVSIFVNPAQFAPTEDLASYPRTLPSDIEKLATVTSSTKKVSAIFAPTVAEMYPSPDGRPFTQHVKDQIGAFVEVQGLAHQMEGASRPTFFRGVATVCTKLFHVVQPDLAYFGQKDIQQAIILRRLVSDLLFAHPPSAQAVRVMKTMRDSNDGLALSSRNAYLTPTSRKHAPFLYKALSAGRTQWEQSSRSSDSRSVIDAVLNAATNSAQVSIKAAQAEGIKIDLLYISLNDPSSLTDLSKDSNQLSIGRGAILSAAALISEGERGRVTRLIDNILLGFTL